MLHHKKALTNEQKQIRVILRRPHKLVKGTEDWLGLLCALADLLSKAYPGEYGNRPLPDTYTKALPGTRRKMRIMQQRIADGKQPCHPNDFQLTGIFEHIQRAAVDCGNGRGKKQKLYLAGTQPCRQKP